MIFLAGSLPYNPFVTSNLAVHGPFVDKFRLVDGEEGLFHSFVEDEVEGIALLGVFSEDFALLGVVQFPRQHRTIGIDGDDATPEALGRDADGSSVA